MIEIHDKDPNTTMNDNNASFHINSSQKSSYKVGWKKLLSSLAECSTHSESSTLGASKQSIQESKIFHETFWTLTLDFIHNKKEGQLSDPLFVLLQFFIGIGEGSWLLLFWLPIYLPYYSSLLLKWMRWIRAPPFISEKF